MKGLKWFFYAIIFGLIVWVVIINSQDVEEVVLTINVEPNASVDLVQDISDIVLEKDARATFFLTAAWAQNNNAVTVDLAKHHEIGCYTTSGARLANLNGSALESEIVSCKDILEEISGQEIRGFRAPKKDLAGDALLLVADNYFYDSSIYQRYGWFWEPHPEGLIPVGISSVLFLPLDDSIGIGLLGLDDLFFSAIRRAKQETIVLSFSTEYLDEYLLDFEFLLAQYAYKEVPVGSIDNWLGVA